MSIQDDFKQLSADEYLLMQVDQKPTRRLFKIDVGNATQEVAEEAVKRLREKLREEK